MRKRTASMILTAALAVSMLAMPAYAAEAQSETDVVETETIYEDEKNTEDVIEEVIETTEESEDISEDLIEEDSEDETEAEVVEESVEDTDVDDPEDDDEDYGIELLADSDMKELTSDGGELDSGNYYLAENITLKDGIRVKENKEITIDLNGHTLTGPWITGTDSNSAFIIYDGTLNLIDSSSDNSGIVDGTGCYDDFVVTIQDGGTFVMDGGKICNGVGCGVFNLGSFTMNGGKICDNESSGVYCASENAAFTMNGGEISENGVTNSQGGGGVCIYAGSFTMTGGEIKNNWSNPLSGGGVYVGGNFTMTGGTISGNKSDYGGGVYAGGNFTMKGGVISGNLDTDGRENNIYLPSGSYISLTGALTVGSSIGITTETKPTAGKPVQITMSESNTTYYKSSAQYFFSDAGYTIQANDSGRYVELSYDSSGGELLNGVCKASDGKWYYYVNGVVDTSYTGFATNENGSWYMENGVLLRDKNTVIKDELGTLGSKNDWYYVIDSKVQYDFTGLANYSNASGWWYITDGKVDRSYNGLAKNNNGWYYLTNGKVDRSYTGFAINENGSWYMTNGKLTRKDNTVIKDTAGVLGTAGEWYYVIGSKVQYSFTGLANYSNASGWWYITDGMVDRSYNGLAKNNNGWYYLTNGKVDRSYTGFAINENGSWYMTNGKLTRKDNTVIKDTAGVLGTAGEWYYVVGSKVQYSFTGLANYSNASGWWYITDGAVDRSYNGLAKNNNGWFYLTNGKVDRSFTGLATNSNGTWYMVDGKLDRSYTGTVTIDGTTYYIENGKVTA